jgi:hypothetical protein
MATGANLVNWNFWKWQFHPLYRRLNRNSRARLRSESEVMGAVTLGVRIDVNRASIEDWLRLPGISIHQARTLVTLTEQGTYFMCLEDLALALRVPESSLQPLKPILQFCYYDSTLAMNPQNQTS